MNLKVLLGQRLTAFGLLGRDANVRKADAFERSSHRVSEFIARRGEKRMEKTVCASCRCNASVKLH